MGSLKAVWAEIKKHKSFLVTTHHNPDADAACSALAMAMVLKKMGKKVVVVNEDSLPTWLDFLPQAKDFHKKTDIKQPSFDAVIVLDCGDRLRIGSVAKFFNGQRLVNIDHHISNDFFGDVNLIQATSSSTCEMLYDLFKEAKVKLNKDLSMLLYAGIMTDTGSFRYDNTTAKTHEIAAQLMKFGLSASDLYQRLYVGIPSGDIKRFVDVIHSAELLLKNKVYCVMLPKKTVDGFSKGFDLKEKIFGFLRSVEGVEVVVILHEIASRLTRINLRSQNDFDVAKLASQFEGGGHRKAAGAKAEMGLEQTKKESISGDQKESMKEVMKEAMKEGILIINKPGGITSHDVVAIVRRKFNMRQVGHAGTLDPLATGVLIILLGKSTKLFDQFVAFDKSYRATLKLGLKTTSADIMGKTLEEKSAEGIDQQRVEDVFKTFLGDIEQVPPMVSAVKHKGERLYKLAWKGKEVERVARKVRINDLYVLKFDSPAVEFFMACSKGTYVRQLAEDVGEVLGCGACISQIERTRVGHFDIKDAVSLEDLNESHIRPSIN